MKYFYFFLLIIICPILCFAQERVIPSYSEIHKLSVKFNGDNINAYCLLLDLRTQKEKEINAKEKKLSGNVILFIHGQQQRPKSGFNFTTELALKSKSGIVIIPVCDTPYGKDMNWRGDKGKEVILMELTRHLLEPKGIYIDGYKKITDKDLLINNIGINEDYIDYSDMIPAKISILGWSHGGILSRRLASSYPSIIEDLVHITPSGYYHWGGQNFYGSTCLITNFFIECLNISLGLFRGEFIQVFDSGLGILTGTAGDTVRAPGSCLKSNMNICKLGRSYKDMKDTTIYADDSNFPTPYLKNIVILFGKSDTIFEPDNVSYDSESLIPSKPDVDIFFNTFYPLSVQNGANTVYKILPGNHIGPMVYPKEYTQEILYGIKQYRGY